MKQVTFEKDFDYRDGISRTVRYRKDGGPDKDGTYEVSEAAAEAAEKAGVLAAEPKAAKKAAGQGK